ncbi:MAG: hypothetical protein JST26_04600 [Bacteroidetes bacterium]|nr:hypothetical protein [Bacteroidota bacterium]
MNYKLTILLAVITLTALGQKNRTVELRWKIEKNEKLNYQTIMSNIDTTKFEMNFGKAFQALFDSANNEASETQKLVKSFGKALQNTDYVTTLTNKGRGIIDITMLASQKDNSNESLKDTSGNEDAKILKMIQSLNKGVVLRGSVYETGGIHSFWVKSNQKNLIAVFFELPKKPVKIGDTWSIDINLISNDQNFSCDSSYKINEVTLIDIKKEKGETIAVLKYNIAEYVHGFFTFPSLSGDGSDQETMMKFTHQAIAEFSVDKGRWVSYEGIMTLDATGYMTAQKKTRFALVSE